MVYSFPLCPLTNTTGVAGTHSTISIGGSSFFMCVLIFYTASLIEMMRLTYYSTFIEALRIFLLLILCRRGICSDFPTIHRHFRDDDAREALKYST